VEVFREVRRVLADDGTLWVVIGDCYAGSRKGGATHPDNAGNYKQGTNRGIIGQADCAKVGWGDCKPKDLIGIPWMLAFALRVDGWYLRQDIIWSKPNPMPESVKDRCTKSHEYIFLLSKSRNYYYDAEAISESVANATVLRMQGNIAGQQGSSRAHGGSKNMKALPPPPRYGGRKYTENPDIFFRTKSGNIYNPRPRRNKRDVWRVSTKGFKGAHFATYPPELITPCVLAGCPEGGIVLDPFFGAGTTGEVALKYDRHFVGIELNADYIEIANSRLDPLLAQCRIDLREAGP
jgi:DNA modification methylase